MRNSARVYVGAYAIVYVPQRTEEYSIYSCPNGCYLDKVAKYCWLCGSKIEEDKDGRTVPTTLNDLIEDGKIEEDKYHSIYYDIDHIDVDAPFIYEPLLLVSNSSDDDTEIAHLDPRDGSLYPWDVQVANITAEDSTRCTTNFIRLYFKELSELGETGVHFGVLKDVEV